MFFLERNFRSSVVMLATVAGALLCAASARAQVFFTPVQYQYGGQSTFYYGGSDPRVFAAASGPSSPGGTWGRVNGFAASSGDLTVHREVSTNLPMRVYSDAVPQQNARLFGYTPDDARNDASAAVPRFFTMAGVLRSAIVAPDGTVVVPPTAGEGNAPPAMPLPPRRVASPSTRPTIRPLLIIPKPPAPAAPGSAMPASRVAAAS